MKRLLSAAFDPPAPMVPVLITAPDGLEGASLEGKIDTGADICAIPDRLVAELDLSPVRTVRAAGFGGVLTEVMLYRVDLVIGTMSFPRVEALATRRPYAIVGRNVLRSLVLRIDGPRAQLELRKPAR